VIGDDGEQLGIMPPYEALKKAREQALDLVEIAPTAQPPVCKIMDYGKFLYQQSKRQHEAKKHQHSIVIKEVKFRPNVDEHDYTFKKNHAIRFLGQGDKVKAVVEFRGREMTHQEIGREVLQRLISEIAEHGVPEARPRMEGRFFTAILAPAKKVEKKPAPPKPKPAAAPAGSVAPAAVPAAPAAAPAPPASDAPKAPSA
jgi:translation initiation factor IF-3